MKAKYIPTTSNKEQGVEPEVLAACLARYSRSNEGIEKIMSESYGKSPDAIFKFIDYGHASIGGLTGGIAIAIDGVSMLLAYKFFEFAQMADGQESSTRYIAYSTEALPKIEEIGIPQELSKLWNTTVKQGFELYNISKDRLEEKIANNPELANLPEKALKQPKVKERMLKNYALDRTRYFLPFACKTSLVIVASARIWADILKLIESLQWKEAIQASKLIREELSKVSPNLIRHSYSDEASINLVLSNLESGQITAVTSENDITTSKDCECRVEVFDTYPIFNKINFSISDAFNGKVNRYSHLGSLIKRQTVQTEWSAVSIAELRDLNRHRTGYRFSDFLPKGFYIPEETIEILGVDGQELLKEFLENYKFLIQILSQKFQTGLFAYGFFLGTQVAFEHTQQADKFIYETELRTGMGAHFKYAEHLRQSAELYFVQVPLARNFITIGDNEPE